MHVYTYSEARQKLSEVLDMAEASGRVVIRRRDGRSFELTPVELSSSPLDIPAIDADISTKQIVNLVRKGRRRG